MRSASGRLARAALAGAAALLPACARAERIDSARTPAEGHRRHGEAATEPRSRSPFADEMEATLGTPRSFSFREVPLRTVLEHFQAITGNPMEIESPCRASLEAPITLEFDDVPTGLALSWVLEQSGLRLDVRGREIHVSRIPAPPAARPVARWAVGVGRESSPLSRDEIDQALRKPRAFGFRRAPLRRVLEYFEMISGIPAAIEPSAGDAVATRVSLHVTDAPTGDALARTLRQAGLRYETAGGRIRLSARGPTDDSSRLTRRRLEIEQKLQQPISFDFQDTPLEDVLEFLEGITGIPIIPDPSAATAAEATIALKVDGMATGNALKWVLRQAALRHRISEGAIEIVPAAAPPGAGEGAIPPSGENLAALWEFLGEWSEASARVAAGRLLELGEPAVRFLEGRIHPAAPPDAERIRTLVQRLDDDDFAAREGATAELLAIGPAAEPIFREALAGEPSSETRERLDAIMASPPWDAERRRRRRAEALLGAPLASPPVERWRVRAEARLRAPLPSEAAHRQGKTVLREELERFGSGDRTLVVDASAAERLETWIRVPEGARSEGEALSEILRQAGLRYRVRDEAIEIVDAKAPPVPEEARTPWTDADLDALRTRLDAEAGSAGEPSRRAGICGTGMEEAERGFRRIMEDVETIRTLAARPFVAEFRDIPLRQALELTAGIALVEIEVDESGTAALDTKVSLSAPQPNVLAAIRALAAQAGLADEFRDGKVWLRKAAGGGGAGAPAGR